MLLSTCCVTFEIPSCLTHFVKENSFVVITHLKVCCKIKIYFVVERSVNIVKR